MVACVYKAGMCKIYKACMVRTRYKVQGACMAGVYKEKGKKVKAQGRWCVGKGKGVRQGKAKVCGEGGR